MLWSHRAFSKASAQVVFAKLLEAHRQIFPDPVLIELAERDGLALPPLHLLVSEDDVITLDDGSELLPCFTHDRRRATVWLGRPSERTLHRAEILLRPR